MSDWKYCPECGCDEYEKIYSVESNACKGCGQEWFFDINYENEVHGNLKKIFKENTALVANNKQAALALSVGNAIIKNREGRVTKLLSRVEEQTKLIDALQSQLYNVSKPDEPPTEYYYL